MAEEKPEQKQKVPNVMKSAAAVMAADIMLLVGFVFLLLGISKLLNGYLGTEGAGEGIVGIVLLIMALVILARTRMTVSFAPIPIQKPEAPKPPEAPSESYR